MVNSNPSVLVVGGGTWGSSTALHLVKRGFTDVTVLDRYAPPAAEAAGNDVNKIVRTDYSEPLYGRLAMEAIKEWSGPLLNDIYYRTGWVLAACHNEQSVNFMNKAKVTSANCGIKGLEDLPDAASIHSKFPILNGQMKDWTGYFNPAAGWVKADEALYRVAKQAQSGGAKYVTGDAGWMQKLIVEDGKCLGVICNDGSKHYADKILIAAGAWTEGLIGLDSQLTAKGHMIAQIQLTPEEIEKYKSIPLLDNLEQGCIFPPREDGILKFTHVKSLTNMTKSPLTGEYTSWPTDKTKSLVLPKQYEDDLIFFRNQMLPELKDHKFSYTRVCWCTDSKDQHFLITEHPKIANLSVAAGGSAHGYKFLPIIGKYIADMMEGKLEPAIADCWKWRPGLKVDTSNNPHPDFALDYKEVKEWSQPLDLPN